jgi:lysophospholipase L1-like esterase
MIARVTIPGDAVRVRFDNGFGTGPLTIGAAYVGQRMRGASLAPGSNRQLFFNRSAGATIPPGGSAMSDPVPMPVLAGQDLAVSLHIPQAKVRPSQHTSAQVTSYITPDGGGNLAADETGKPFTGSTTSLFWVKAIDVQSSSATGAIVAFGDSITDGTCSTLDAHDRWVDWLAARLVLDADRRGARGAHKAVVNEGIGGNTVTREKLEPPPDSPPGLERIDRDVFSHAGVTDVVLFMGTNDIRRGASAAQVIAGTEELIKRVKARGLKVIGATIIPRHNAPPAGTNTGWNAAKTATRQTVNEWIRSRAAFDGVLDFDRVVRDPGDPNLIYAPLDCDGIHPTPLGYFEMGRSVPLELFAGGPARAPSR